MHDRERVANMMLLVSLSGAVGGFCFWLYQRTSGILPFGWRFYAAIPALLVFGGIAGLFGVYVLANSSTSSESRARTLVFALLCGFSWHAVFDAAQQSLNTTSSSRQADMAETKSQELQQSVKQGNQADIRTKLDASVDTTTEALRNLPAVNDDQVRGKIQSASFATVNTVTEASKTDPDASVNGLEKLGTVAAKSNDARLTQYVLNNLDTVARQNPALSPRAKSARESILKATVSAR